MQRSTTPAGASAGQDKSQEPQGPERSSVQNAGPVEKETAAPGLSAHAGADLNPQGATRNNGGPAPNSMSELGALMEESAGGPNHGRRASANPEVDGRHLPLGEGDWQAAEFMRSGGFEVVDTSRGSGGATLGARDAGMSAHRGVIQEQEYVDSDALRSMVERELGFSYEQIRSVYRQGRLSATQRELRARIDARMLALSHAGGNMAELGRVLGFHVNESGACEALNNALARAREAN